MTTETVNGHGGQLPAPPTRPPTQAEIDQAQAVLAAQQQAAAEAAAAQQLELPRPSPSAKVSQVVGITEIAVEYSSPAVKGRKVFGGIVPLGELWRTGANGATKVTFSKDVTIGDKPVPAGTYALFTIPAKDSWTVIFNKNPNQGGTDQYKQDLDQLRFEASLAAADRAGLVVSSRLLALADRVVGGR